MGILFYSINGGFNMAITQYIGARYVPLFYANPDDNSNNWKSGIAYDPLTVVTDVNQSYTSKIPVPASVGRPSENPTYWIMTGAYNAQVEQYRQEVEDVSDRVEVLEERTAEYPNVIMIGDSYGHASGTNTGWIDRLSAKMNIPASNLFETGLGGAGFKIVSGSNANYNAMFNTLASSMSAAQLEAVGLVILIGGSNDTGIGTEDLQANVITTVTNIKNRCPNAKIYVGEGSGMIASHFATAQLPRILPAYRAASSVKDVYYLNNLEYCNHDRKNLNADLVHLNNAGYAELTNAIYAALKGSYNYTLNDLQEFTPVAGASNTSTAGVASVSIDNGNAHMTLTNSLDILFNSPVNFGYGASVQIANFNSKSIIGDDSAYYNYNRTYMSLDATVFNSTNNASFTTHCVAWLDGSGGFWIQNADPEKSGGTSAYSSINRFIVSRMSLDVPSFAC